MTNYIKRLALAIAGSKYDRPEAALPRLTREQLESQIRAYSPDAIAVLKELRVIASENGRRDTDDLIRIFIDKMLKY